MNESTGESGFERRKRRKHEQILQAALALFQRHGFRRVSIADIAGQARVSQVTIYNHFGSKETLIRETLRVFLDARLATYEAVMDSDLPYLEKLERILVDKNAVMNRFRGEMISAIYRDHPELVEYARRLQREMIDGVTARFLDEGREKGYVPKKTSNEAVMLYMDVLRSGLDHNPEQVDRLSRDSKLTGDLLDLIAYGIARRG